MKKAATWCAVIVAVIWLINDPSGAAALAHSGIHALERAASALGSIASSFG